MLRLCRVFTGYVLTSLIKILGFLSGYHVYRSKADGGGEGNGSNFSVNHSPEDGQLVSKNSTGFLSGGLSGRDDSDGKIGITDEVGLIAKYQFVSSKDACGYFQEPRTEQLVVQEMFVGSDEGNDIDQSLGCGNFEAKDSLGKTLQGFDAGSDTSALCFKLFNASCFANGDGRFGVSWMEEDYQEPEKVGCAYSEEFGEMDVVGDEILEEKDVSFDAEVLPDKEFTALVSNQESDAPEDDSMRNVDWRIEAMDEALCGSGNWMGNFLEESDQIRPGDHHEAELDIDHTCQVSDLDDEYIEMEPHSSGLMHIIKERVSCEDGDTVNEPHEHATVLAGEATLQDSHQEQKNSWDSGNGDEEDDEQDVLLEHQHLIQQMKMELKNCRTRSLPTISEECETPKIAEDLKPLHIEQKIEYKDIVKEIQKFYKSYTEKMRKLDILNYQTLHAISFLQLKVSEVIAAGNMKGDWVPFVLPKMRPYKVQRIYADPMHKSILELYHDLELVYIGQVCLSWEILCWMYMKARELLRYDPEGNHSYNQVADEFQQFQVLLQRFVEDEQFQGQRMQNYATSRCMIKCLLQVPTIRDYCLKTKKEQTDAVSLKMLIQIIRESMLIFRDFFFADKRSMTTVLKDIHETKLDPQSAVDSQLLVEIITDLHKKERKIREHIRSKNCVVKKLKRHHHHRNQELRPDDDDVVILTSQVELKLVSRVLSLSRLTRDQLIWCQYKIKNINFVRRKVHLEPTFLLFPC